MTLVRYVEPTIICTGHRGMPSTSLVRVSTSMYPVAQPDTMDMEAPSRGRVGSHIA